MEGNSYIIIEAIKSFRDSFKLDDVQDRIKSRDVKISDEELKIILKSCVKKEILKTDGYGDYWLK